MHGHYDRSCDHWHHSGSCYRRIRDGSRQSSCLWNHNDWFARTSLMRCTLSFSYVTSIYLWAPTALIAFHAKWPIHLDNAVSNPRSISPNPVSACVNSTGGMLDFFRGNIYGFGRVDILNVAAILCSAHAVDGYDCGVDSHFHKLHSFFFCCNLIVYGTIRHL